MELTSRPLMPGPEVHGFGRSRSKGKTDRRRRFIDGPQNEVNLVAVHLGEVLRLHPVAGPSIRSSATSKPALHVPLDVSANFLGCSRRN